MRERHSNSLSLSFTVCVKRGNIASAAFSGLLIAHAVYEPQDKKKKKGPASLRISRHLRGPINIFFKTQASDLSFVQSCQMEFWDIKRSLYSPAMTSVMTTRQTGISGPSAYNAQETTPSQFDKCMSHSASLWSNKVYNNTQLNITVNRTLQR